MQFYVHFQSEGSNGSTVSRFAVAGEGQPFQLFLFEIEIIYIFLFKISRITQQTKQLKNYSKPEYFLTVYTVCGKCKNVGSVNT